MKIRLIFSFLVLLIGCNDLIAMQRVTQLQPPKKWQYSKNTFKFKCVDSTSDEDVIEVPGILVHYSKTLTAMIDDIGDPTITIPLFKITKEAFKRIIQALVLVGRQKTYEDLLVYFGSLGNVQTLLECALNINFLDIQSLLVPAMEVLQKTTVASTSNILTWKKLMPQDVLAILKDAALDTIQNPLARCSFNEQSTPMSYSSIATNQNSMYAYGLWDNTILLAKSDQQQSILQGHTEPIDELQFSPDGQKLASFSPQDETIRLWDVTTQKEVTQFRSNQQGRSDIQFSADNNYFACISSDVSQEDNPSDRYVLINRKTGKVSILVGVRGYIQEIMVSRDGKKAVLAGENIYLWNTETQQLTVLDVPIKKPVNKVAFSPDGTLLACGSIDIELETVEIVFWNVAENKINAPLAKIITGNIPSHITFSQDNTLVAFNDGEDVQVMDVQNDNPIVRVSGHVQHVHSIEFTPDNTHLVTTAHDNVIRVFNLITKEEKKLESDIADVIDYAYTIGNTTVVSVSEEGLVSSWDLVTGQSKKLMQVSDATGVGALSPDETLLAENAKGGKINLLNIKTGEIRVFTQGISVIDLDFSADSQSLFALYANGTAALWNIKTGIPQKIVGSQDKIMTQAHCIGDCSFVFAYEETKNFINLYDIQKNTTYKLTRGNDVEKFVFSPDGKHLIASSKDYMITVWDVPTQTVIKQFNKFTNNFTINPDGTMLVISDDKHISFIDLANNTEQILITHANSEESYVERMVFNADGSLLAICKPSGGENRIELWDMRTRMLKDTIQDPVKGYIANYFFVPNTAFLVIVGAEMVLLWDIHANQPVIKYDLQCWSHAVVLAPDGSGIVVSGVDEQDVQETKYLLLDQTSLKTLNNLSFEQAFIVARALKAGSLDLTKSPELLKIFNQIEPVLKDKLKDCFQIKTE